MQNLTSKELTALEDQLNWEDTLIKKYKSLAAQSTDSEIRSAFTSAAKRHQKHYNKLTGFLQ